MKKTDIQNIYSLSPMQEGMLFHYQYSRNSNLYFEQAIIKIEGRLDLLLFQKTFNQLIRKHEVLRTVFTFQKTQKPRQIVLKAREATVFYEDLSEHDEETCSQLVDQYAEKDRDRGFDLSKDLLMRIALLRTDENSYKAIWSFHHIIMDGWCFGILVRDFLDIYDQIQKNESLKLNKPTPYSAYISWLERQDKTMGLEYWKNYLAGFQGGSSLPKRAGNNIGDGYSQRDKKLFLNPSLTNRLVDVAREAGATPNTLIMALWGILLGRVSQSKDIVFGCVVSGRPSEIPGVEQMVGLFINTIPVRMNMVDSSIPFNRLLKLLQVDILQSQKSAFLPLVEITEKSLLSGDLFDHIIGFENYPLERDGEFITKEGSDLSISGAQFFEQTNYDLTVIVTPGKITRIHFKYNEAAYREQVMEKVAEALEYLAEQVATKPGLPLCDMALAPEAIWNETATGCPPRKDLDCILNQIESCVNEAPDHVIVVSGPPDTEASFEFGVAAGFLWDQSRVVAENLLAEGLSPGDIIGVSSSRSIEWVLVIVGILRANLLYMPLDIKLPDQRKSYMAKDGAVKILLVEQTVSWIGEITRQISIDDILSAKQGEKFQLPHPMGDTPAYLIYTSGSTGRPKGVLVEHGAMAHFVAASNTAFGRSFSNHDRCLVATAIGFDVSISELAIPFCFGAALVVAPDEWGRDAATLSRMLLNGSITFCYVPPALLNGVQKELEAYGQAMALDKLMVGVEPIKDSVLAGYLRLNPGMTIINVYGPTESTIFTIIYHYSTCSTTGHRIPIGQPMEYVGIRLVDDYFHPVPSGLPGEILISGRLLARGYLNKPEQTAERFLEIDDRVRVYKTGDQAFVLPDGNIEFIGRFDNQVKIRGHRIELEEIGAVMCRHPHVQSAVVTVIQDSSGDSLLCGYYVADENRLQDDNVLRNYMASALPDYMIPNFLMKLESFPRTPNGKIDRRALPAPHNKRDSQFSPPTGPLETGLARIWGDVLDIPFDTIGIDDDFFLIGGHSLRAMLLSSKIYKEFGTEFPIREVFEYPTIRMIARFLGNAAGGDYSRIQPVELKEYYPLSPAQKRLYFLEQLGNIGTAYNMFTALSITGSLDEQKLREAFLRLVRRHESFRTSFLTVKGHPAQRIHREVDFSIECVDSDWQQFIRPFNLKEAPLLRVGLQKNGDSQHILLMDMHHIVSDGTSMGIVHRDLINLYNGEQLEELHLQYRDYASWQFHLEASGAFDQQERYWLERFSDKIPRLHLATDFPRPATLTFSGDRLIFELDTDTSRQLLQHCRQYDVTLFMNLLAAFNVLMHKYTGQQDIVTGTGVMGRPHADTEQIAGMFVNALALRTFPQKDITYLEFLDDVRSTSITAFENQGAQFEEVVDKLGVQRDPSRNPLFDVMMVVQNFQQPPIKVKEVTFAPYEKQERTSKFDMTLFAYQQADIIQFKWEYNTSLFKDQTIQRMADHLISIIRQCTGTNQNLSIDDIDILTKKEKEDMLVQLNRTESELSKSSTIVSLFLDQARVNLHRTALAGGAEDIHLSYECLLEKAEELALFLKHSARSKRGMFVAILLEQGVDCIIAIMGILMAGHAYLPIDPTFPESRIRRMLDDVGVGVLLSQKKFIRLINRLQWECQCLKYALVLDSHNVAEETELEQSQLMESRLWEYVGEQATDDITGGGWQNSFTGESFSRQEMDEYGDNVLEKLKPLLNKEMRVLEIGSASGITMFRVAPLVGFYFGCDLSQSITERNREIIKREGITNIELACLPAHEVGCIKEGDFDIIIINSVIQCFNGHNYLRQVLRNAVAKMKPQGLIFAGDIMDQDLKKELELHLKQFQEERAEPHHSTKTDWSTELFLSRGFFEDLVHEMPEIIDVQFSNKIHTIENELTRYRYDALIRVNKNVKEAGSQYSRHKFLWDRRRLKLQSSSLKQELVKPDDPAYIIYTSGSTGMPKGTFTTHRNVVRVVKNTNYLDILPLDRILQLSNTAFDGSIFDIFGPLLNSATLVLPTGSNERGIDIIQLANLLKHRHISVFFLTTALFNTLVDIDIDCFAGVRKILFGGERVSLKHTRRALRQLGPERLIHVYGPTETTVYATYYPINHITEKASTVPIGKPISNTSVYVLDNQLKPQPYGVPGELWIGGSGLATGYLNNPDMTAQRFIIWNGNGNEERLYRSGDLVRLLPEEGGVIEFIGRVDRQVKIRGFRIELSEIEHCLLDMNQVREAVVLDVDSPGGERILEAWFVPVEQNNADSRAIKEQLTGQCPEFMIPAHITAIEEIPLTPNGKVDKQRLLSMREMGETSDCSSPETPTEESLIQIWSALLGLPPNTISVDADFFQLGGHSLKATMFVARVQQELGVKLPLAEVFRTPFIRRLAETIDNRSKTSHPEIIPWEKRDYYPLSSAQQRMYILQQSIKNHTGYNMPAMFQLSGTLDPQRVKEVFVRLIQRHASLRTSFFMTDETPVQRIEDSIEFSLEECEGPVQESIQQFIRPFQLDEAPLLRVGLVIMKLDIHLLMIDMHHIISDGVSLGILVREFMDIYQGEEPALPPIQYRDYALWEDDYFHAGHMKRQENYWLQRFKEKPLRMELPLDFPRPRQQRFTGDTISYSLTDELTESLRQLCREADVTMFMALSSLLRILLAKLCCQSDIVIGTPVSGRTRGGLEQVVGMFVNTLPLRGQVRANSSFVDYLAEVKSLTIDDFQNQDYPFDQLVDKLGIQRQGGRNPLFDVMFSFRNIDIPALQIPGLTLAPYLFQKYRSVFDLTVTAGEDNNQIYISIEFSDMLFKKETVERLFVNGFNVLLYHAATHPETTISSLEFISPMEKEEILQIMTATSSQPPIPNKSVLQLIEHQLAEGPDNIALFDSRSVTYKEMTLRSRRLSKYLKRRGLGRGSIAAIRSKRSVEMVMGILAILQAGGAYLPIDPNLPEERIRWMREDSSAQILLTEQILKQELASPVEEHIHESPAPEDLAYIIYTSGSTGRPKGVMMEHRGLSNFIGATQKIFAGSLGRWDRCLSVANIVFDASVAEIFLSLTCGGLLTVLPGRDIYDPEAIGRAILVYCVTFTYIPPSLLSDVYYYLDQKRQMCGLNKLWVGAEPISGITLAAYRRLNPQIKIINAYGPTEAAVCATMHVFEDQNPSASPVPIGKPLENTSIMITNSHRQIQPKEVAGEILIGGEGLARGYLNSPELTHLRFVLEGERRLYCTGDIASLGTDGIITFIGRRDNQVKIRGHRIELGEISQNLEQIPFVSRALAIAYSDNERDSVLVAYVTVGSGGLNEQLCKNQCRDYLQQRLPFYMIPGIIMIIPSFPLNPAGKVDISALPEPIFDDYSEAETPLTALEGELAEIWGEILGTDPLIIGPNSDFFLLGGHSLKATRMIAAIRNKIKAELTLEEIFRHSTIKGLVSYIQSIPGFDGALIGPCEKMEYYPASGAQRRIYMAWKQAPESTVYNMPVAMKLKGALNSTLLKECFHTLYKRHDIFRTSFFMMDEALLQRVIKEQGLTFEDSETISFIRPFHLQDPPLLRVSIRESADDECLLLVDMHHIASDGTSVGILVRELTELYSVGTLPPLSLQYRDYAFWQNRFKEDRSREWSKQKSFWFNTLKEELPVLALPVDFPKPRSRQFSGADVRFTLDEQLTGSLGEISTAHGTTMFSVLLAIYNVLLARLSNQEDIIVGTAAAGRNREEWQDIVGMFVNTLPLRNFPLDDIFFGDFLAAVGKRSLSAFQNQDLQLEEMIDHPPFDVFFVYQNMELPNVEIGDAQVEFIPMERTTAKFDLLLDMTLRERRMQAGLEYNDQIFKPETVEALVRYFIAIATAVVENPDHRLGEIELLSPLEKQRLLSMYTGPEIEVDQEKTVIRMFEDQATKQPNCVAIAFEDQIICYRTLNRMSSSLGRRLAKGEKSITPIIAICSPHGPTAIASMLAVLKTGAAFLMIPPEYPAMRKTGMIIDSGVSLLVSDVDSQVLEAWLPEHVSVIEPIFNENEELDSSALKGTTNSASPLPLYAVYTSGSTGTPRGVLIGDRVISNLMAYQSQCATIDFSRVLQFASLGFDVAVQEIFSTFAAGGRLQTLDHWRKNDVRYLFDVIDRNAVNTVFLPTAFFKFLFGSTRWSRQFPVSVCHIVVAGERLTLSSEAIRFLSSRAVSLHNHYGPSETHVVTAWTMDSAGCMAAIPPIGTPIANSGIHILNRKGLPQPQGVTGELWVCGPAVGMGYLNLPLHTHERFTIPNSSLSPDSKWYRTGDLARLRADGAFEYLGRIDRQLKIRGFRVEPGEIETILTSYDPVDEAVVVSRDEADNQTSLIAYITTDSKRKPKAEDVKRYLEARLPSYMIPSFFILMEEIPLTANGKVDRRALPQPEKEGRKDSIPPANQTEALLLRLWSRALGIKEDTLGVTDDFFVLGGHSLKATMLASRIEHEMAVEFPLGQIFKHPTIRSQAEFIDSSVSLVKELIEPLEAKEYYPLSSPQRRIFLLHQMVGERPVYNMPFMLKMAATPDAEKIEQTFKAIIQRHESFRTSFTEVNDEPVQQIQREVEFELELIDTIENWIRPFDLSKAPLLRVGLLRTEADENILLIDIHHIVCDGISLTIMMEEFLAFYSGGQLPEPSLHYKDVSIRLPHVDQTDYWLHQLRQPLSAIELPTDFARSQHNFSGDVVHTQLDANETASLKEIAHSFHCTYFMVLVALYSMFLSKISGQEDIIVGTPVSGRDHPQRETCIGMFVNTLALRFQPRGDVLVEDYLREVKTIALEAFEHQDAPFEELVEKLGITRDPTRNPLFDVMFTLNNVAAPTLTSSEFPLQPVEVQTRIAKFHLTFGAVEAGDVTLLTFEYSDSLFKKETIHRWASYFKGMATDLPSSLKQPLFSIELLSRKQKYELEKWLTGPTSTVSNEKEVSLIFRDQCLKAHERIALQQPESNLHISYGELIGISDSIALALGAQNIGPGLVVAVPVSDPVLTIISMMAILMSGASYLPLDLSLPTSRLKYMLKDSSACCIVGDRPEGLDDWPGMVLKFEDLLNGCLNSGTLKPVKSALPAYIIYTSGSTGTPKGTMIPRSAITRIAKENGYLILNTTDRILQWSNLAFDGSVFDMYGALLNGVALVTIGASNRVSVDRLGDCILREAITIFFVTTALFNAIVDECLPYLRNIRHVLFGGERVSLPHAQKAQRFLGTGKVIHVYGPTETTVFATHYSIDSIRANDSTVPIGRPVANTKVYLLDRYHRIVPAGVTGEIWIGGQGLAHGYLNQPEMTGDMFQYLDLEGKKGAIRLYRSGDLGRLNANGEIEFVGREDRQLKIRGFRIELGEIEHRLQSHPKIREVTVALLTGSNGETNLAAYYVPQMGFEPEDGELRDFLSASLPKYMIPAHFIRMEKIPLTPNGKVDQSLLPLPQKTNDIEDSLPKNPVQQTLADLWGQILGIESALGINDDFFLLGGHSIKASIMLKRVRDIFKVSIPLMEFFRQPFIHFIETCVSKNEGEIDDQDYRLVKLRHGNSEAKPLFLIHAGSGEVDGYLDFCNRLSVDCSCWGIRVDGDDYPHTVDTTIQRLAESYLPLVRGEQPVGPYRLAGWSIGGTIACEMALQLQSQGENVEFLGLMDSSPPQLAMKDRGFSLRVDVLAQHSKETMMSLLPDEWKPAIPGIQELELDDLLPYIYIILSLDRARNSYTPSQKIAASVHYFAACQSQVIGKEGWETFSEKPVRYWDVNGDHYSIFSRPNVEEMASIFSDALLKEVNLK